MFKSVDAFTLTDHWRDLSKVDDAELARFDNELFQWRRAVMVERNRRFDAEVADRAAIVAAIIKTKPVDLAAIERLTGELADAVRVG